MRFGINVPNFGPGTGADRLRDWCERIEGTGFHLIMMSDHVALTPEVQRLFPAPFYDPLTTLSWLAGFTRTVELGTTVLILPYRHPLQTARVTATLDQLSGGRLVLGVAAGWAPGEFAALGLDHERRGELMDESLAALTLLWTQDVATYEGKHYRFYDVHTAPRPLRRPPLWVGGTSRAAFRRAVRYGTAWHPTSMTISAITAGASILQEKGGPPIAPRIKLRITDAALPPGRLAGEGTPEQVHGDLVRLRDLGAEYIVVDTTFPGVPLDEDNHWKAVATLTEQLVDLADGTLR